MFFKLPGAPFIVNNDLYVKPTVQLRRMTGWRLNDLWCVFPAIRCNIEVLKHPHNRIKWFSRKHKKCERLVVPCSSHFISLYIYIYIPVKIRREGLCPHFIDIRRLLPTTVTTTRCAQAKKTYYKMSIHTPVASNVRHYNMRVTR